MSALCVSQPLTCCFQSSEGAKRQATLWAEAARNPDPEAKATVVDPDFIAEIVR